MIKLQATFYHTITVATLLSAGCADDAPQEAASASDPSTADWRIDSAPTFRVGDDPAEAELFFTNVMAVRLLGDRILVVNARNPAAVVVLNTEGEQLRTLGGEGEGPGEFRFAAAMWTAHPDTLIVYDPQASRLTYLRLDGTVLRTVRFEQPSGGSSALPEVIIVGRFSDDTYLTRPNRTLVDPTGDSGRSMWAAERRRPDGRVVDTIAVLPDADYVRGSEGGHHIMPLFGNRAALLAAGEHLWAGIGDEFVVEQLDLEGQVVRRYERPFTSQPVTEELITEYQTARLASVSDTANRARMRERLETTPAADVLPAFDGALGFRRAVILAEDGTLWVQGFRFVDDSASVWSVFDANGRFVAETRTPPRLTLHDVGPDFVVGVWRDELDVETVVRFELTRE